ncbi:MAG: class I SAM-dependent methyltransferase, partial [Candidatus Spyradocola sp.]
PEAGHAIVVMEGVSMYLTRQELAALLTRLRGRFRRLDVLMDCYTVFAAKASKWKNPVNTVGAHTLYGVDDPETLAAEAGLRFTAERELTPPELVAQLQGFDRWFFVHVMAGGMAKKIYRLYEMTF